jgi:hypothetical protein
LPFLPILPLFAMWMRLSGPRERRAWAAQAIWRARSKRATSLPFQPILGSAVRGPAIAIAPGGPAAAKSACADWGLELPFLPLFALVRTVARAREPGGSAPAAARRVRWAPAMRLPILPFFAFSRVGMSAVSTMEGRGAYRAVAQLPVLPILPSWRVVRWRWARCGVLRMGWRGGGWAGTLGRRGRDASRRGGASARLRRRRRRSSWDGDGRWGSGAAIGWRRRRRRRASHGGGHP